MTFLALGVFVISCGKEDKAKGNEPKGDEVADTAKASASTAAKTSDAPDQKSVPVPAEPASDEASIATCKKGFVRQRECTDEFISALVDVRIELDIPSGIAEEAKADKDALIAKAKEEWAKDSTDEAIDATCNDMVSAMPNDRVGEMVEHLDGCVANVSCDEFVTCMMPMVKGMIQMRAQQ